MSATLKNNAAVLFRSLGNMLLSGVPIVSALDAAIADTTEKRLKTELQRIKKVVLLCEIPENAWPFLPESIQLIWQVGQKRDLAQCCLRIAEVLDS